MQATWKSLMPAKAPTMKPLAQAERHDAARHPKTPLRVAVAGLGAIGLKVAEALDLGIPGCVLAAVSANDLSKAGRRPSHLGPPAPVVTLRAPAPAPRMPRRMLAPKPSPQRRRAVSAGRQARDRAERRRHSQP